VLQGKALTDAVAGGAVSVLNLESKKTIEAVAAGPGAPGRSRAEMMRAQSAQSSGPFRTALR